MDHYYRYNDYYFHDFDSFASALPAFLVGFLVVFFIIAMVIAVAAYVISAMGMYTMAKRRGIPHAFLAWIPVASSYLLGSVADHINSFKGKKSNYAVLLVALSGATLAISWFVAWVFPAAGLLTFPLSIALLVFTYMAVYEIFKDYAPKNAVVFLVLGIIFGIYWIFIFALRNKQPVTLGGCDPTAQPPYGGQAPYGQAPYGQGYGAPQGQQNPYGGGPYRGYGAAAPQQGQQSPYGAPGYWQAPASQGGQPPYPPYSGQAPQAAPAYSAQPAPQPVEAAPQEPRACAGEETENENEQNNQE